MHLLDPLLRCCSRKALEERTETRRFPFREPVLAQFARAFALRRLTYESAKLAIREYFNREGEQVSRELFAPDGFITERVMMAKYGNTIGEAGHWWWERGTPIRRVAGRIESAKDGDKWTQK